VIKEIDWQIVARSCFNFIGPPRTEFVEGKTEASSQTDQIPKGMFNAKEQRAAKNRKTQSKSGRE
jgi:hypothetical protein